MTWESRNHLTRRAVELGTLARRRRPDAHPDDAWESAWDAIRDEAHGSPSRAEVDRLKAIFLVEFLHQS